MSSVFTPFQAIEGPEEEKELFDYLDAIHQMSIPIKNVSPAEVKKLISTLNPKKAPGYDLISGKVLKELPKKAIVLIASIINAVRANFQDNGK